MRKLFLLLFLSSCFFASNAQSILKKESFPLEKYKLSLSGAVAIPMTQSLWRIIGPLAGYSVPGNQVVTGIGFGRQWQTAKDSAWFTNFSASIMVFAGGNVQPQLNPFNLISAGVGFGFDNNLIVVCPVYNFSGQFGLVLCIAIPLIPNN